MVKFLVAFFVLHSVNGMFSACRKIIMIMINLFLEICPSKKVKYIRISGPISDAHRNNLKKHLEAMDKDD